MAFGYGEGPNKQNRTVIDMKPDDGGEPRKLWLSVVDAKEYVERDPGRYSFDVAESHAPA